MNTGRLAVCFFMCIAGTTLAESASAAPVTQDAMVEGNLIRVFLSPNGHGTLEELTLLSTGHDVSAGDGLLLEGFGVPSAYVPGRRFNESLTIDEAITDRPVLKYSYDCEGANISGLHIERTIEPMLDEASVRVKWKLEHRGKEQQWVAPWIRNEVAPGGLFEANDRIEIPTLDGIRRVTDSGWFPAARNWIAATDAQSKESVCLIFNSDIVHAFLAEYDLDSPYCAMQTAFVPRIVAPGDVWETEYRVNLFKGLSRIDFATDELAAQVDYVNGTLEVRLTSVKPMPAMQLEARILHGDDVIKLPAKKFQLNPQQVVRCSYPWKAPSDGAYEFLAMVTLNGKQYPLGKATSSPHGGIDTQFLVGKPRTTPFEAWTDAPYALDRGAREIRKSMAAVTDDAAVWFEPALEKIFREDAVKPSGTTKTNAQISLARNERESFQVVVRPAGEKDLRDLSVTVRDLVAENGTDSISASNISVHNVAYHPVRIPSNYEGPTGEWPDALPVFEPATAKASQNMPVWITVYAPKGTPPGLYSGMLEITSPDMEAIELWVEATVYNFELPTAPALKTAFGFWPEEAVTQAKRAGNTMTPAQLVQAYAQNGMEHRVTLTPPARLPDGVGDYASKLKTFASSAKALTDMGATTFAVPETLLANPSNLAVANQAVADMGIRGKAFVHLADEPPPATWEKVFGELTAWKTAAPNIPTMVTTFGLQPYLPEEAGIWAVHLPLFDTANNMPVLQRVKAGGEVWAYVDDAPPRPYGNFFIDFAAIEHRILFWQSWALGLRGMYYASVNAASPTADPYRDLLDLAPTNGNGFLVYPSATGPVSSIRWETIRDGIDDFDYLTILSRLIKQAQDKGISPEAIRAADDARNLEKLIPNLVSFTREPAVLISKRDEIAKAIVKLNATIQGK